MRGHPHFPLVLCGLESFNVFSAAPVPFVVDSVIAHAERYAERIYGMFLWAVTDDFLMRYGGKP